MKKLILLSALAVILTVANIVGSEVLGNINNSAKEDADALSLSKPLPDEVFYHHLQPEFVVNFHNGSNQKFLMIDMAVASYDHELASALNAKDSEIRSSLLLLLAEQSLDALVTEEGKTAMLEQALVNIKKSMGTNVQTARLKEVVITRLYMQ